MESIITQVADLRKGSSGGHDGGGNWEETNGLTTTSTTEVVHESDGHGGTGTKTYYTYYSSSSPRGSSTRAGGGGAGPSGNHPVDGDNFGGRGGGTPTPSNGTSGQSPGSSSPQVPPGNKSNIFKRFFSCCCCCRSSRRRNASESYAKAKTNVDTNDSSGDRAQNSDFNSTSPSPSFPDQQSGSLSLPPPDGYLLPSQHPSDSHKPTMVIDLDETLVHSSFKPISNADFIVPVEIDGVVHQVYVAKRPFVDEFLEKMSQLYECVLFTASLSKYADPVADLLDRWGCFKTRLFREACVFHRGNYVKDLNKLGRSLQKIIIIDNSPASYIFHPDNAVPVASWFDDTNDTELLYLIPFFERLATVDNVYTVLRNSNHPFNISNSSNNPSNNPGHLGSSSTSPS